MTGPELSTADLHRIRRLSAISTIEEFIAQGWQEVKEACPNTHQANHDLALARTHFEDGLSRLRKALLAPPVPEPWKIRHNG